MATLAAARKSALRRELEGIVGRSGVLSEPDELLRHGVLPSWRKREVFVGTLEEVVFPGLDKLGVAAAPARAWLTERLAGAASQR